MKNGGKGLKNAFFFIFGYKLQKSWRVGLPIPPAANLFVENYMKNGGKGLKNASFWVIIS